ncbi:MAG: hypothetical protein HUJ25_15210 [Crocinitomicaceae bacterium]|nr:hypothetical protein [Crocinitomicaceae bacterium]
MNYSIEDHFIGKENIVKEIYDKLVDECENFGNVVQAPKKTCIHLDSKYGFAGVYTRKSYLLLHIHLNVKESSGTFERIEQISKSRFKHVVRIDSPEEINTWLIDLLHRAYKLKS